MIPGDVALAEGASAGVEAAGFCIEGPVLGTVGGARAPGDGVGALVIALLAALTACAGTFFRGGAALDAATVALADVVEALGAADVARRGGLVCADAFAADAVGALFARFAACAFALGSPAFEFEGAPACPFDKLCWYACVS